MILCFTLTLLDAVLSVPPWGSVFAGFLGFCVGALPAFATCTYLCIMKHPTKKPPWDHRKVRGTLVLLFLAEIQCLLITVIKYPPNKQEKIHNTNKKLRYCFRITPGGERSSLRTSLCLASPLLLQGVKVLANKNSVSCCPGRRRQFQPWEKGTDQRPKENAREQPPLLSLTQLPEGG